MQFRSIRRRLIGIQQRSQRPGKVGPPVGFAQQAGAGRQGTFA